MVKKLSFSIRTLAILSVIALVVLVLPLILSSFYNRPILDDLVQPYPAKVAYQQTGSIIQTFIASVKETVRIWNAYSGIYSSMFLSVFAPYTIHYTLGYIHPIMIMIVMFLACLQAARCIRLINREIPFSYILLIASMLCIMLITTMPGTVEGLFWYSAAINYTFFFALTLLLFSSLLHSVYKAESTRAKSILQTGLYCLGFFFLAGGNWVSSTSSIVIYGFFAVFLLWNKKPLRFLIPYLFLIGGFLLAVAAPGNIARQDAVGERVPLFEAFFSSFLHVFEFIGKETKYYLLSLLLFPVFARLSRYMPKLPKSVLLFPIASLCILAAAYFPMLYSGYTLTSRHKNVIFFLFSVLLLVNEALFVFCLSQLFRKSKTEKKDYLFAPTTIICTAVITFLVLHTHSTTVNFATRDMYSNYMPIKATQHLLMGYSKNYAGSYDHLVNKLQTTDEDVIISDPSLKSPILGTPDLQLDPTIWINEGFVKFYTDKNDILLTQPREE